ncbi:GumC family protein [Marinicrinis lubricantis]|uniref:GumC family protein n=1 Tax=Marinicrinis lubricantis TaxID=2086470 RepID=A0ABW1IKD8_9BACL
MMQEEISLRELLETIWKGKWLIASITAVAIVASLIISFFILPVTYEAKAVVRFNVVEEGQQQLSYMNSLTQTIKSDVSINRIVQKLNLDPEKYSFASVRDSLNVELVQNSNVVNVTMKGTDPEHISKIANQVAYELGMRAEITDRSQKIVGYKAQQEQLQSDIAIAYGEVKKTEEELANVPEILVTRKSLTEEPFLQSIAEESNDMSAVDAGGMQYIDEEVNPVFTELKSKLANANITLAKLQQQFDALTNRINEHNTVIAELEQQINDEKLSTLETERMLNGSSAVFVSPGIAPEIPVGPNKTLNLVISVVLGFMIGIVVVFIRHYWVNTAPVKGSKSVNTAL